MPRAHRVRGNRTNIRGRGVGCQESVEYATEEQESGEHGDEDEEMEGLGRGQGR